MTLVIGSNPRSRAWPRGGGLPRPRHKETPEAESLDAPRAKEVEHEPTDDGSDNPEHQIEEAPGAGVIDDFAAMNPAVSPRTIQAMIDMGAT